MVKEIMGRLAQQVNADREQARYGAAAAEEQRAAHEQAQRKAEEREARKRAALERRAAGAEDQERRDAIEVLVRRRGRRTARGPTWESRLLTRSNMLRKKRQICFRCGW